MNRVLSLTIVLALAMAFVLMIALAIIGSNDYSYTRGYYEGQIDAKNGKIVVELQDKIGAKVWTATQPAKKIFSEKYYIEKLPGVAP